MNNIVNINDNIKHQLDEILNFCLTNPDKCIGLIPIVPNQNGIGAIVYYLGKKIVVENNREMMVYSHDIDVEKIFYFRICLYEDYVPKEVLQTVDWNMVKQTLSVFLHAPLCHEITQVQSISQLSKYYRNSKRKHELVVFDMQQLNIPKNNNREIVNQTNQLAELAKSHGLTVFALYSNQQIQILKQNMDNISNEGIISLWNGYAVHGDVRELDHIVESRGFINLDKNDIIETLSKDGENYVATGCDANIGDAFSAAVADLPGTIEKVNKLLIQFQCGVRQPDMAEIGKVTDALNSANKLISVRWGLSSDSTLGENCKVVLLAYIPQ